MYDAVIVGARCAGAATALLLSRQGRRVLLVDRSPIPSDTMSTLFIRQPGVEKLAEWGLLPELVASGCPALDTISYDVGEVRLDAPAPMMPAYAPRRYVLDQLLVRAAVAAGTEVVDRTTVRELVRAGDRVAGVKLGDTEVRARLVIGADGMRSRIAELVAAPTQVSDPPASCVYYTTWHGIDTGFGFHERPGNWIVRIPTHDGLTLVSTYFPQRQFDTIRRDPLSSHLAAVKKHAPDLDELLRGAEQTDRIRGTGDQRNFFRGASGPGWALVGDAGHHLDTITASGITNAFLQADLFASALDGVDLADPIACDAATMSFSGRRDEALIETYRSTLELAKLTLSESRTQILRAVSSSPELTACYFAVVMGVLDAEDFFNNPDLLDLL